MTKTNFSIEMISTILQESNSGSDGFGLSLVPGDFKKSGLWIASHYSFLGGQQLQWNLLNKRQPWSFRSFRDSACLL